MLSSYSIPKSFRHFWNPHHDISIMFRFYTVSITVRRINLDWLISFQQYWRIGISCFLDCGMQSFHEKFLAMRTEESSLPWIYLSVRRHLFFLDDWFCFLRRLENHSFLSALFFWHVGQEFSDWWNSIRFWNDFFDGLARVVRDFRHRD